MATEVRIPQAGQNIETATLACDHCAVNGAMGVCFLEAIKRYLEVSHLLGESV